MMQYSWPGNVRELYNIIERSLIIHSGHGLLNLQLDAELNSSNNQQISQAPPSSIPSDVDDLQGLTLATAEKRHILMVLDKCQGKVSGKKGAAEYLDLPVSTLRSRMKKLDISPK